MEKEPENPNAFATANESSHQSGVTTLLDYFAGKAMEALIRLDPDLTATKEHSGKSYNELIAEDAYFYASEMLRERKKFLDENS